MLQDLEGENVMKRSGRSFRAIIQATPAENSWIYNFVGRHKTDTFGFSKLFRIRIEGVHKEHGPPGHSAWDTRKRLYGPKEEKDKQNEEYAGEDEV